VWISFVVLLPMLAVIAVAEAFAWRSVLIYAGLGLGLGLWVFYSGFVPPEQEVAREREISAAAGIVAGFVYWALAGRNAGRWRERPALRGDRRSEETPSRPEESPR
jgi:hypothetical protein